MPLLNPFSTVKHRAVSLFEIRPDNDFIVFRGNEHESAGQQLQGVIVLCLSSPLKIEEIKLRLTGTLRHSWADNKSAPSAQNGRVDLTNNILQHHWSVLPKSVTLQPGNYEWPFEYTLPGRTAESIEGIPEASITYRLKASVVRGKLSSDIHTYKALRIIRTLDPSALELLHAMSVENVWPEKVDYSIALPRKAVPFGASVSLEMRFTPLLKGLKLGRISARLLEVRECEAHVFASGNGPTRQHRTEREVSSWRFDVAGSEHWRDAIEETGQEGWVVSQTLPLPRRLDKCIQDVNHNGIKVRHKLKVVVGLKNPDGHVSELRASLPLTVFISPDIPLDEQGNLATPSLARDDPTLTAAAPPGYGDHVLDTLYEGLPETSGFRTPAVLSAFSTPYMSRAGSSENLGNLLLTASEVHPATLSTILSNLPLSTSPAAHPESPPPTSSSDPGPGDGEGGAGADGTTDGAVTGYFDYGDLSKVPSYSTALRSPLRSQAWSPESLPDYAAVSGERSTTTPRGPSPEHQHQSHSSRETIASLLRMNRSSNRHQRQHSSPSVH